MLKNHAAISSKGSIVEFKLHTQAALDCWKKNVVFDDWARSTVDERCFSVEHRYAQDLYAGRLATLSPMKTTPVRRAPSPLKTTTTTTQRRTT